MSKGSFIKGLITGIVAGTTAGVVTGLLTAPKSGKELRKDLRNGFESLSSQVQKKAQELEVNSKEMYEKVVEEAVNAYEKVKNLDKKDILALRDALVKEWEAFSKKVAK